MKLNAILLVVLAAMPLACSPSQQAWAERGKQGVVLERANVTGWYTIAVDGLMKDRDAAVTRQVASMSKDLQLRFPKATSQPASMPSGRAMTYDEYLAESVTGLLAEIRVFDDRKATLDANYRTTMSNLDSVTEAFDQIEKLNRVWATDRDALAAQVSQLTSLVQQMAAKGAK